MRFELDVTLDTVVKEFKTWYDNYRVLRFGQYFCNEHLKQGCTFPELYYEKDHNKAVQLIRKELRSMCPLDFEEGEG